MKVTYHLPSGERETAVPQAAAQAVEERAQRMHESTAGRHPRVTYCAADPATDLPVSALSMDKPDGRNYWRVEFPEPVYED